MICIAGVCGREGKEAAAVDDGSGNPWPSMPSVSRAQKLLYVYFKGYFRMGHGKVGRGTHNNPLFLFFLLNILFGKIGPGHYMQLNSSNANAIQR